jgi:hypothetical protein
LEPSHFGNWEKYDFSRKSGKSTNFTLEIGYNTKSIQAWNAKKGRGQKRPYTSKFLPWPIILSITCYGINL